MSTVAEVLAAIDTFDRPFTSAEVVDVLGWSAMGELANDTSLVAYLCRIGVLTRTGTSRRYTYSKPPDMTATDRHRLIVSTGIKLFAAQQDAEWLIRLRKSYGMCQAKFWAGIFASKQSGCQYETCSAVLPQRLKVLIELKYGPNPLERLAALRGATLEELIKERDRA
jgi:hypothetical protein